VFNSFAFDFIVRCKQTGTDLNNFIIEQLPFPDKATFASRAPWDASVALHEWLTTRSVALSATTDVMAMELGLEIPIPWDARRRESWRVELDSALFHVYGYSRDEIEYVMDTFPIVARGDREVEGLNEDEPNWRTKRLILEKYDELARHAEAGTAYGSPDPPPPLPDKLRLDSRDDG
jgi:hypothetical protein